MIFAFHKQDSLLCYLKRSPLSSTFWSLAATHSSSVDLTSTQWSKLREDRTEKARSSLNHAANDI